MRWKGLLVSISVLGAACALAKAPDAASTASSGAINAVLEGSLDARKATPGQMVRAKTLESTRLTTGQLPEETLLIGEVTHAQPRRGKIHPSEIAFTFRLALAKDGKEIPIRGTVRAVAAGGSASSPKLGPPDSASSAVPASAGAELIGGVDVRGHLVPESKGVFGLPGVQFATRERNEGVVLSSDEYNVHLDRGTRLLVLIEEAPHS